MWCVCEEGGVCGVCVRERGGENVTCTMNIIKYAYSWK